MSEGNKNSEKEAVQESPKNAASEQSRESFSHQAIDEAIRAAQGAGHAISDRASNSGSNEKQSTLPSVTLEDSKSVGKQAVQAGQEAAGKVGHDSKNAENNQGNSSADSHKSGNNLEEMAKKVGQGAGDAAKAGSAVQDMNKDNDKIADKISDMIKDGKFNPEDLNKQFKDLFKQKDGVESLPTGDHIVREDGKQTLFTPNGDRISINPDGTNTVKGDVSEVKTNEDGSTTVTFGDGARVQFDKEGFLSIDRGNQGIAFGRIGHGGMGPKDPFPIKPWGNPGHELPGNPGGGIEDWKNNTKMKELMDKNK